MSDDYVDKPTLLREIDEEWTRLEAALAPLGEAQMVEAGAQGQWSVKDVLAHVTWWERWLLAWRSAARGEALAPEGASTDEAVDRLNERTYLANRDRPLADVLADLQATHRRVVEAVEAMSDDGLTRPTHLELMPEGAPAWEFVAANTWRHYPEHYGAIESWSERGCRS